MKLFQRLSHMLSRVFCVMALSLALVAQGTSPSAAQSPVVLQDNFNRTGDLNGDSPTIGAGTWVALAGANGLQTATTGGGQASPANNTGSSGNLPFTLSAGSVYTYSVRLNSTTGNTNWVALGFGNASVNTGTANQANNLAWIFDRGDGSQNSRFYGGGTANGVNLNSNTVDQLFTIVLDTTTGLGDGTQSTLHWYTDGTLLSTSAANFNATTVSRVLIGQGSNTTGTYKSLSLSTGSTWLSSGSSSWATGANWGALLVPNAAGATATFGPAAGAAAAAITLDGDRTVGVLAFANVTGGTPGAYTIAQGTSGSLIFNNSGAGAEIYNYFGANIVSAPVRLDDNLTVIASGGSLNMSGAISEAGGARNLTKTGAATTLTFSGTTSNTYTGATNVNDGTLLLSKTPVVDAIGGGTVNVGDGAGATGSALLRLATGSSNQINDASNVAIRSDGIFQLNGQSETIQNLTGISPLAPGPVALDGGTLAVNGTFDVNTGASGGTFVVTDTAGTGTLDVNGTIRFDAFTSSDYDVLQALAGSIVDVSGATFNLNGTTALTTYDYVAGFGLSSGDTLTFIDTAMSLSGNFANVPGGSFNDVTNSLSLQYSYIGGDFTLTASDFVAAAVPEPTAVAMWSLLGFGAMAYGWRRRK